MQRFHSGLQRTILLPILVMGILWVLHVVTIYPTFSRTFVAYVGTLKRFNILLSVIFGYLFFKEKDFKKRLWAAIIIVTGAMLIASDDLPGRLTTKIDYLGF